MFVDGFSLDNVLYSEKSNTYMIIIIYSVRPPIGLTLEPAQNKSNNPMNHTSKVTKKTLCSDKSGQLQAILSLFKPPNLTSVSFILCVRCISLL